MSNRKINYNRQVPSSESVKNRQNFDDVLSHVTTIPKPFFKSIGFWGAIGSSVIAITLFTSQFLNAEKKKNAYEATPTLAIQQTQLPEDTKCITPINKSIDHEFETFSIDPDQDNTILLEGGAIISIPANAFEDLEEGNVMINARVFRNKSEAFVAGVPMDYGTQSAFESAGMIELRGEQNGEEVKIKEDKEIKVTLGLHKSPEGFDFYALDESDGQWSDHEAHVSESKSVEQKAVIEKLQIELASGVKQQRVVKSEINRMISPTKSDYNLAENNSQVFELKFNKQEFPELKSFERLQFEAKCNKLKYSEILQKTWSNVELQKGRNEEYKAVFSNQRGDETLIEVVPVVTGNQAEVALERYKTALAKIELEKALKEKELEEIEAKNKARKKRIEQIKLNEEKKDHDYLANRSEAFVREFREKQSMLEALHMATVTFRTNRWGVFNSDKPVNYPKFPNSPYAFTANNQKVTPDQVYVFDLEKDVRYQFGTHDHPLRQVALNNNQTVIVVKDRDGNMSYASLDGKGDIDGGQIALELINAKEADLDFFKTLLDEKERVRA